MAATSPPRRGREPTLMTDNESAYSPGTESGTCRIGLVHGLSARADLNGRFLETDGCTIAKKIDGESGKDSLN